MAVHVYPPSNIVLGPVIMQLTLRMPTRQVLRKSAVAH